ncbi:MAG TPA: hypothetical protein ENK46_09860 [Flavobacteriia bacterium]|nr:hypothetical protein [Flavobacteriia bacterium]
MSKLFVSCEEATAICNKNQYKEASFWEKMKLQIHLFICKKCGLYSKQNATITKVCNRYLDSDDHPHTLSEHDKEIMQHSIEEKIDI